MKDYQITDHGIKLFDVVFQNKDSFILPMPKNGTTTISGHFRGEKHWNLSRMPRNQHYEFATFIRCPIERFWSGLSTAYYNLSKGREKKYPDHVMKFILHWVFLDQHLLPQTFFLEKCYQHCPDSHIKLHHLRDLSQFLGTESIKNSTRADHARRMKKWALRIDPNIEDRLTELHWRDLALCELLDQRMHFEEIWGFLGHKTPDNDYGTKYFQSIYKAVGNLVADFPQDKAVLRVAKLFPALMPKPLSTRPHLNLIKHQKKVKMAGVVFWFQSQDKDVFSCRPIDLDAWRYAIKSGGINQARCFNETPLPLFFDQDFDFEIAGSNLDDFRDWAKDKSNLIILQCEWSCPESAIPLSEVDHSKVDWYVFGRGSGLPNNLPGQYVYLPQDGLGGLHPVHTASAVLLRRWEELTKEK